MMLKKPAKFLRDLRTALAEEWARPSPCPMSMQAEAAGETVTATPGLRTGGRCLYCGSTECQRAQEERAETARIRQKYGVSVGGLRHFVVEWFGV